MENEQSMRWSMSGESVEKEAKKEVEKEVKKDLEKEVKNDL